LKENLLGSLQPGKWADFTILDRNYLTILEEDSPNIKVLATAVGGKFVHVRREIAADVRESPRVHKLSWLLDRDFAK
jgi:cytosine/adenosine deaminase-related metal-dependent hydrolase